MIDISEKSWHKYFLFVSLYFSEGLQAALATVIIPIYLLDKGFSLPVTTLVAGIGGAPWYLKFVFGPTTDYFYKLGKKPFIIVGGLLGAFSLFFLVIVDPLVFLIPFTFFLFLSHLGITYMDVSCDGWAIQISKENERGKINGAMFAGLYAGMAVGTSLVALVAQAYGYGMSFLFCGSIILLVTIYPFLVKEVKISEKRPKIASILKKEFKKRNTQLVTLICALNGICIGILLFVIPLYMKTILHMDIGQIGLITTIYPLTFIIGSLLGGALTDRWGRKIVLYIFISVGIIFYPMLLFASIWQIFAVIYGVCGFIDGVYGAAIGALMMDYCNPKIGTTQYSILASILNFGEFGTGSISGSLVAMIGFGRMFLLSSWIGGPLLLVLYFIRPKKNELHVIENE
jgi:PAT family beta-lactamase induction signal transducer AmpG